MSKDLVRIGMVMTAPFTEGAYMNGPSAAELAQGVEQFFMEAQQNATLLQDARTQFHQNHSQVDVRHVGGETSYGGQVTIKIKTGPDAGRTFTSDRTGYQEAPEPTPLVAENQGGKATGRVEQANFRENVQELVIQAEELTNRYSTWLEQSRGEQGVEAFKSIVDELRVAAEGHGGVFSDLSRDEVLETLETHLTQARADVLEKITEGGMTPEQQKDLAGILAGLLLIGGGLAAAEMLRRKNPRAAALLLVLLAACKNNPSSTLPLGETEEPTEVAEVDPTVEPEPTMISSPTPQEVLPTPTVAPEQVGYYAGGDYGAPDLEDLVVPLPGTGGLLPKEMIILKYGTEPQRQESVRRTMDWYEELISRWFDENGAQIGHSRDEIEFVYAYNYEEETNEWNGWRMVAHSLKTGEFFWDDGGQDGAWQENPFVITEDQTKLKDGTRFRPVPNSDEAVLRVGDDGQTLLVDGDEVLVGGQLYYSNWFNPQTGRFETVVEQVVTVPEWAQVEVEAKGLSSLIEQEGLVWSEEADGFVKVNSDGNKTHILVFETSELLLITDLPNGSSEIVVGVEATNAELEFWQANVNVLGRRLNGENIFTDFGEELVSEAWAELQQQFNLGDKELLMLFGIGPGLETFDPTKLDRASNILEDAGYVPVYRLNSSPELPYPLALRTGTQGDRWVLHIMSFSGKSDGQRTQARNILMSLFFTAKGLEMGRPLTRGEVFDLVPAASRFADNLLVTVSRTQLIVK